MKIINLTLAIICSILVTSCSPDKSDKSAASTQSAGAPQVVYSDAIYPLGQVIHLAIQPESVRFQTINLAKNTGEPFAEEWGIVALMKFSDENIKTFIEKSTPVETKNLPAKFSFSWLKPTLEANFKLDTTNNDYAFNKTALNAEFFYRSPLMQGAAFQVSSNEILVYLRTQ
jgi:hypothetical protein